MSIYLKKTFDKKELFGGKTLGSHICIQQKNSSYDDYRQMVLLNMDDRDDLKILGLALNYEKSINETSCIMSINKLMKLNNYKKVVFYLFFLCVNI